MKIGIKILYLCTAVFISVSAWSQKQAVNWLFGYRAGITWNTTQNIEVKGINVPDKVLSGLPTNLPTSPTIPINTLEGCFSLSDAAGNLMFFSDGVTIWNRNMKTIVTNLTGNSSSAQSGIIIPNPGHPQQYMGITMDDLDKNRFAYAIVDMSDGLGTLVKAESFPAGTYRGKLGESVTAIQTADKEGYWILAPSKEGRYDEVPGSRTATYMNVWKVTKNGIVFSSSKELGFAIDPTGNNGTHYAHGYLKCSPDGAYFAWATWSGGGRLVWGRFDTVTGKVGNVYYSKGSLSARLYGLEFSPSGKYIYLTDGNTHNGGLFRIAFDNLPSTSNVDINSRFEQVIPPQDGKRMAAVQLGPDGRLYVGADSKNSLFVVEDMEESIGNIKSYYLGDSFLKGTCQSGLPSFSASWFNVQLRGETYFCTGTAQSFTLNMAGHNKWDAPSGLSHVLWNFGDGTAEVRVNIDDNTAQIVQQHTYANPGVYEIIVKIIQKDGSVLESHTQELEVDATSCVVYVNPHIRSHINN